MLCICGSPIDLIIVVIQSDDVHVGEFDDFSGRSTYTATDVQDGHSVSQAHHMREIMFMTRNGLVESFAICETAEVERASPSVFIYIRCEVVVAVSVSLVYALRRKKGILLRESGIFFSAALKGSLGSIFHYGRW